MPICRNKIVIRDIIVDSGHLHRQTSYMFFNELHGIKDTAHVQSSVWMDDVINHYKVTFGEYFSTEF